MADASLLLDLVGKALTIVEKGLEYNSTRRILKTTTKDLGPVLEQIERCIREMDLPTEEIQKLKGIIAASQEVHDKYSKIRWWNCYLAPYYQRKLDEGYQSLVRYSSVQVQMQIVRDLKVIERDIKEILSKLSSGDHSRRTQTISALETNTDRIPTFTVGLDGSFMNELKYRLLNGDDLVLNLYGLPGSGKTTLARILCRDPHARGKFKSNISFETLGSRIQSNEEINQLLERLSKFGGSSVLCVLDDVWPDLENIVDELRVRISSDSKILVTSRHPITRPGAQYPMKLLCDDDAEKLFLHFIQPSAIDFGHSEIRKILLQIIKGCMGLPLALEFIGRQLHMKGIEELQQVQLEWSRGLSILDSNTELLARLQNSLHLLEDESVRECFMDLGLFPEDQRIPITALIDMWIELYDLDERGIYAMTLIHKLTAMNLAAGIIVRRKVGSDADNYYNNHFLVQHDLFRELAIHISNQEPFEDRKRLIIDMNGNHRPEWWPKQQQQPQQGIAARTLSYFNEWLMDPKQQRVAAPILSISTDQNITPDWCNIRAADAVVLVLNLTTTEYTLPEFVKNMRNLKVLIVTNYGFRPTKLKNHKLLGSLWRLKRIRLQQILVPSLCELKNVHKLSLYMCGVKMAFENRSIQFSKAMPHLVDLNIEYCKDLVKLPAGLCDIASLKKLSISNCHKFTELPEEIGKLENLDLLRISYCADFKVMPASITKLKSLTVLDISYCISLGKLPDNIGELRSLRKFYMTGCPMRKLPGSVIQMEHLESVICDDYTYPLWEVIKYKCSKLDIRTANEINLNWLLDFGSAGFLL